MSWAAPASLLLRGVDLDLPAAWRVSGGGGGGTAPLRDPSFDAWLQDVMTDVRPDIVYTPALDPSAARARAAISDGTCHGSPEWTRRSSDHRSKLQTDRDRRLSGRPTR